VDSFITQCHVDARLTFILSKKESLPFLFELVRIITTVNCFKSGIIISFLSLNSLKICSWNRGWTIVYMIMLPVCCIVPVFEKPY
jgi:hypothetical protein